MKEFYKYSFLVLSALVFSATSMYAQTGDACNDAIPIDVNINDCQLTEVSNVGLTNSGQTPLVCGDYAGGDLWLSVVVPPSGEVLFSSQIIPGETPLLMNVNLAVYSGACGALTQEGCDAGSGPGNFSEITFTGTPGATMFIQMWSQQNEHQSPFNVCANGTPSCNSPAANFIEACSGNNEYEVNVQINLVGSGNTLTITDGTTDFVTGITTTGTHTVGPFDIGSEVTLTLEVENDASCSISEVVTDNGLDCEYVLSCGTPLDRSYCYGNNDNNGFLYTSPSGSDVTILFNSGLNHSPNDRIIIRESIGGPIAAQSNDADLTGFSYTSTTGQIYLEVDSDPGGSCQDGSLDLGGGWNWTVTCDASMCDGATNIVSQNTFAQSEVSGNLAGQTYSGFVQCGEGAGTNPDQYFTFTAMGTVQYIRVVATGDFDPVVQVFDQCDGTPIVCVDEAGPGLRELFWMTDLTIGQTYAYRVYHDGIGNPTNTAFQTAVAHIPTVQLRSSDCGSTDLVSNSLIRSISPNPNFLLDGFIWEFTENEAPNNVYEVNSPNGANPHFRMSWFGDFEYGRSYSVRVKARMYQGPNVGEYGPACDITMADEVGSALQPQYADEFYDFCDIVKAVKVYGATNYRWVFDDGENQHEYNSNNSNYSCRLDAVNGLEMNTSYDVQVFVTSAGTESTFSIVRTINTHDSVTNTGLNPAYVACGSSVNITQWTQAFKVCAAEYYTFRFTNLTQPEELPIEKVRPNRVLTFSHVSGLIQGDTYNVAVKAFAGGLSGDYSTECMITFNEPSGFTSGLVASELVTNEALEADQSIEEILPAMSLYPNPVADKEVMISVTNLTSTQQEVVVRVYDLSGRLMLSEVYGNNGSQFNAILKLDDKVSTGIYIVNTSVDGVVLENKKLIVE